MYLGDCDWLFGAQPQKFLGSLTLRASSVLPGYSISFVTPAVLWPVFERGAQVCTAFVEALMLCPAVQLKTEMWALRVGVGEKMM
jgi:hypothetical protein